MATPSPGYAITVRVETPSSSGATSGLVAAVSTAKGVLTALDVVESHADRLVVDVTCNASDAEHADMIVAELAEVPGVTVRKVSDRTFLMHLGGKIEVNPRVPLKNRDDLSRAYTPGVARVCLAIAKNPEDVRRLTIKRNTVAVVTDGSAVLGLGNIGPYAALPVMEGKAALFKQFAGVDAWPICLDTQDTEEIIRDRQAHRPGLRRHQPRGHRRAALLRDRAAAARRARHPRLPRRPARHRHRRPRRAQQRAEGRRQADRGRPRRRRRRRRRRARDHQAPASRRVSTTSSAATATGAIHSGRERPGRRPPLDRRDTPTPGGQPARSPTSSPAPTSSSASPPRT